MDEGESYMGALLIYAETEEEAKKRFASYEHGKEPKQIVLLRKERGIIYDDSSR